MKQIFLIITLSFGFLLTVQADSIPNIGKWYECHDKLEKQKIKNSHKLCSDKYARKIPYEFTDHRGSIGASLGGNMTFKFEPENTSQYFVITKTDLRVWLKCKNKSKCNYQEYDYSLYEVIEPGVKKKLYYKTIEEIFMPDNYLETNFSWNQVDWGFSAVDYGFEIDF